MHDQKCHALLIILIMRCMWLTQFISHACIIYMESDVWDILIIQLYAQFNYVYININILIAYK